MRRALPRGSSTPPSRSAARSASRSSRPSPTAARKTLLHGGRAQRRDRAHEGLRPRLPRRRRLRARRRAADARADLLARQPRALARCAREAPGLGRSRRRASCAAVAAGVGAARVAPASSRRRSARRCRRRPFSRRRAAAPSCRSASPNSRLPLPSTTGKTIRRSSSTRSCSSSPCTSCALPWTTMSPSSPSLSFATSSASVAVEHGRVVPLRLLQRRGDDVLGHALNLSANSPSHRRPRGGEAFVGARARAAAPRRSSVSSSLNLSPSAPRSTSNVQPRACSPRPRPAPPSRRRARRTPLRRSFPSRCSLRVVCQVRRPRAGKLIACRSAHIAAVTGVASSASIAGRNRLVDSPR